MIFLTHTDNGYDVGGPEPLCIQSLLPDSSSNALSEYNVNTTQAELQASCPLFLQNISFSHMFEIVEDGERLAIYQGDDTAYPFQLQWFDTTDLPVNTSLVAAGARLFFCDAEWGNAAPCHPLVDVRDWNTYNSVEDDLLNIIPTIARSTRLATTPWFDLEQNPTTQTFQVQDGISKGLYYIVMHFGIILERSSCQMRVI